MAKAKPRQSRAVAKPKVVLCPFTILVDCNEVAHRTDYTFQGITADADQHYAPIKVPTMQVSLDVGDYGLFGYPGIVIERKTKSDIYQSIGHKRENFIERLKIMNDFSYAAVVVECEVSELLANPPVFTAYSPKSLFRTIQAWSVRYRGVAWWFMPGREFGERLVFRLLDRFWRDRQGV